MFYHYWFEFNRTVYFQLSIYVDPKKKKAMFKTDIIIANFVLDAF